MVRYWNTVLAQYERRRADERLVPEEVAEPGLWKLLTAIRQLQDLPPTTRVNDSSITSLQDLARRLESSLLAES